MFTDHGRVQEPISFRKSCVLQSGEPPLAFVYTQLSLLTMPLSYPIMIICYQLICLPVESSKQVFFWCIQYISQSFVAPVSTCLQHVAGINFRISIYSQTSIMAMRRKHQIYLLCSVFKCLHQKVIHKWSHSVFEWSHCFIYVLHSVPAFWNWGFRWI